MRKVGLMIFCLLIISNSALAQKQANVWCFGDGAGVDFNSGKPVAFSCAMTSTEGCASIADANGKLLFYSNGVTVWDRSNMTMPNGRGLYGHTSSTQSCIIVPLPGNNRIFYLFTVDCWENGFRHGLCYSIVDMNANGGMGDVVSKNIPLLSPTCEKVTACQRMDRNEYWIVTHKWNSDSFYTFRLSSAGITGLPVISRTGDVIKDYFGDMGTAIGYMKISSDGKKLAAASHESGSCELFNFDDATGKVGSRIFKTQFSQKFTYGLEFSPNSKKLYLTVDDYGIFQYDISVPLQSVIQNSKTRIYPLDTNILFQPGALQLSPDHKIYIAVSNAHSLDAIESPDAGGLMCRYKPGAVSLGSSKCYLGLPDFIKPFFHPAVTAIDTCYGSNTRFSLSDTVGIDSVFWNFGDSSSISRAYSPAHQYSRPGLYMIKLVGYASGHKDSVRRAVNINLPPETQLDTMYTICGDDSIQIDAYCEDCSYHWSDSSEGSFIATTVPGKYWVRITRGQCVITDSTIVRKLPKPKVKLGKDTLLCYGETMLLKPHISYAIQRSWQDGSSADSLLVGRPGRYVMTVSNNCGTASDTINVHYIHPPQLHFGTDTFICGKPDFWLDATSDSAIYAWQDGSNSPKMHVTAAGKYAVTVKNHCGTISRSINIKPKNPIYIELGRDTDLCEGASLVLHAKVPNAVNYLWQDGSTDSVYTVSRAGWYRVQLSNSCSQAADSIYVDYTHPPGPHFGNDTLVCGLSEFTLDATSDKAAYFWNDGSREPRYTVTGSGTYSVVVKNHCGTARRTIRVKMSYPPSVFLGNDTTICDSTVLTAGQAGDGYTYRWQDGSKGRQLKISASGQYSVSVSNECGTVRDSITIKVEQCECPLYTPNSFTPNGDGLNETFKPSSCDPKEYVMRVFNRWGELLFESNDINTGWNGTFEGSAVPEGAYLYTIHGANKSSGFFNKSGIVYVLLPKR